jgi:hypothetical protein
MDHRATLAQLDTAAIGNPNQEQLMPSSENKSSKPTTCPECGVADLVRKIPAYPVLLYGPLEGKQVHGGRVALHQCLTSGYLTPAGQAKVDRDLEMGIRLFLGQLH